MSRASATKLATTLLPLAALAFLGCRPRGAQEHRRPNIILIIVDSLRQDHLEAYGYDRETSPHIDRLAAQAITYTNAFSQAAWTLPSIGSLLTSRFPTQLDLHDTPNELGEQFLRLPEILRSHGYATGAVVSHYLVGSKWRFDQGFDFFDESNIVGHDGISSPGVTSVASDWVQSRPPGPFFLLLHYFDPHYDYIEHEGHCFDDGTGYDGPVTSGMAFEKLEDLAREGLLDDDDVDRLVAIYDSEIAFTDTHIGVFLARMEAQRLLADSLIIFSADHGEAFLDHGIMGHGGNLMNEMIKVPLIIKHPGGARSGTDNRTVGLIDLFPTILESAGLDPPPVIEGRSLLSGGGLLPRRSRPTFSETSWGGGHRAIVDGPFKLVRHLETDGRSFYDLDRDPGESTNRRPPPGSEHLDPTYSAMSTALEAWEAYLEETKGQSRQVEIPEEVEQQLRALGYLD